MGKRKREKERREENTNRKKVRKRDDGEIEERVRDRCRATRKNN